MALLDMAVNLVRTTEFLYKDVDGYTESYDIKDTSDSLTSHQPNEQAVYVNLIQ
jgi:hypothetical protein